MLAPFFPLLKGNPTMCFSHLATSCQFLTREAYELRTKAHANFITTSLSVIKRKSALKDEFQNFCKSELFITRWCSWSLPYRLSTCLFDRLKPGNTCSKSLRIYSKWKVMYVVDPEGRSFWDFCCC